MSDDTATITLQNGDWAWLIRADGSAEIAMPKGAGDEMIAGHFTAMTAAFMRIRHGDADFVNSLNDWLANSEKVTVQ